MKTKNLLKVLLIIVVILIIAVLVGKKKGLIGKPEGIKVAVEKPEYRKIVEFITANGKIQPETEVKISPDVSGEIVELKIVEGENVTKGQLLLKIKPDTYISIRDRSVAALNTSKSRLAQAEAQFEQARLSFERNKKLWEQKTISDAEYEQILSNYKVAKAELQSAKYNVKSAEASLKEAQENLAKTTIYAPMSGTISQLNIEKGERVVGTAQMAGTELLRIADLDRMEVKVEVNENDIVRVALHDTALIEIDAYLGQKFKGVVTEIANSANVTGTSTDQVTNFDVKILLLKDSYRTLIEKNNPNPFRPGMSASVDILTETKLHTLSVQIPGVTTRPDTAKAKEIKFSSEESDAIDVDKLKEVIFVVDKNNKAKVHYVKTGIQDNTYIELLSGADTSMRIIVSPYSVVSKKLKNGDLVEVVDKKDLFRQK